MKKIISLSLVFMLFSTETFANPEVGNETNLWENVKLAIVVSLMLGVWQIIKENYKKRQEIKEKNALPKDDYIYDPSLSDIENQKKRFSQMNIFILDDLIKNKKDEYTEETYNIALDYYKLRTNELENELNKPKK